MPFDPTTLKLGAAPPVFTPRLLSLDAIQAPIAVPDAFDLHDTIGGAPPTQDLGNNSVGDCTMASLAAVMRRFERREHPGANWLTVDTPKLVARYFRLTGGPDSGLGETVALKSGRSYGIPMTDGRRYTIRAYAAVNSQDWQAVQRGIYTAGACTVTLGLPSGWQPIIFDADVLPDNAGAVGSWGWHEVFSCRYGYGPNGDAGLWLSFESWQLAQPYKFLNWATFFTYCPEAYAVFDRFDSPRLAGLLDVPLAEAILGNLTGEPQQEAA